MLLLGFHKRVVPKKRLPYPVFGEVADEIGFVRVFTRRGKSVERWETYQNSCGDGGSRRCGDTCTGRQDTRGLPTHQYRKQQLPDRSSDIDGRIRECRERNKNGGGSKGCKTGSDKYVVLGTTRPECLANERERQSTLVMERQL